MLDEACAQMGDQESTGGTPYIKNQNLKNLNIKYIFKEQFPKLKYMLDCGFNLMIYGMGSKFDLMNLFVQKQL